MDGQAEINNIEDEHKKRASTGKTHFLLELAQTYMVVSVQLAVSRQCDS